MVYLAASDKPESCLEVRELMLKEVSVLNSLYVRDLNETLVSVSQICDEGRIVVFKRNDAIILSTSTVSVYQLETSPLLYFKVCR